jgi:hypothetical protein
MSAFHRIRDISAMRSDALVRLAYRLPAYQGAVQARIAEKRARQQAAPGTGTGRATPAPRYERTSAAANNGHTADAAPPATESSLAALNAQLGATWFSYRKA